MAEEFEVSESDVRAELLSALRALAQTAENTDAHPPFSDQSWVELNRAGQPAAESADGSPRPLLFVAKSPATSALLGAAVVIPAENAVAIENADISAENAVLATETASTPVEDAATIENAVVTENASTPVEDAATIENAVVTENAGTPVEDAVVATETASTPVEDAATIENADIPVENTAPTKNAVLTENATNNIATSENTVKNQESGLLELVVAPEHRQQGIADALLRAVRHRLGKDRFNRLSAWSHGAHPGAAKLAQRYGFSINRELWQLRRSVAADDLFPERLPSGVRLRAFVPGQDERAWLAVNAAAFAHHPEQGNTSLADLLARQAEDWFDPEGFLLAVDQEDRILGFHWTKIHRTTDEQTEQNEPHQQNGQNEQKDLGEIYVLGVAPQTQGTGLGQTLTNAGLGYLKAKGIATILLYVDADNTAAVALYRKLGFTRWDTDAMYVSAHRAGRKTVK